MSEEIAVGQEVYYGGETWTVTARYPIHARLGTLRIVELRHEDGRFEQVQEGNIRTVEEQARDHHR
jgi:hypothetical protein